ncbi:MAG: VapE family protein [bacterium]|nr:VapE family protein [bacterium]
MFYVFQYITKQRGCANFDTASSLVSQPKRKRTGRPAKAASLGKRVRQLVEADGVTYTDGHHNDYVSRCVYLMNRYGIQLNDCLDWTLHEFADYAARHSGTVEGIVQSVYERHANEHATLATHTRKATNKASVSEVERYMNEHCQVKRNLLSYKLESDGKIVDDHFVNSLWRRMQLEGINADLQTINSILGSDYVQDYHPFRQWIESLPPWDGTTDYIRQFFSMVHCTGTTDEVFHFYTRCWFLAMVASVIDDSQVNHEILTFIGRQGTYKSSFMLHILPPHLRGYFTTKNNSYQLTKDDHLMLAQNIIISLEEIDSMTTKEINQLKAFTTMPHINERPPYARHTVLMPRVASLTATGNNVTFLTDQTGNRRWLPFQVERIDNPCRPTFPMRGCMPRLSRSSETVNGSGSATTISVGSTTTTVPFWLPIRPRR